MGRSRRAAAPVAKVDFVNFVPNGATVETVSPQPANHALVAEGALDLGGTVMLNTRALVDEALKDPGVFSSQDLVEQGNTLPLIPLNIDPPDHVKYRRLLDPLFAPRRVDALEADIAERVHHFVDAFTRDRGIPHPEALGHLGNPVPLLGGDSLGHGHVPMLRSVGRRDK